jgi:hypothetical protein
MVGKQDIAGAAEAHTTSYIDAIVSPTVGTTTEHATLMASHYLPTIVSFAEGAVSSVSDPTLFPSIIAGVLDKLETDKGNRIEVKEHRIEVVGEKSAIAWITLMRKGIVWTNVYFFRILESGDEGWEGGIFDGENGMLRQLATE